MASLYNIGTTCIVEGKMKKEDLQRLADEGDVDTLSSELDFVRSMYRSGDITPAEYASQSAFLEALIDQASDNLSSQCSEC